LCTALLSIFDEGKGVFKARANEPLGPGNIERQRAPLARSIMMNEDVQKFGRSGMDAALTSFGTWTKAAQAIAAEMVDYSKRSAESSAAAWEKLMSAKSLDKAVEVQSQYLRSSYEDFVAEATKLGELYADLGKQAYKPFEGAFAKASAMK
jgi:hypothetical protein